MSWTQTRAKIASIRYRDPTADTSELHARMHLELREAKIRALVDQAPPLTQSQRASLAALLVADSHDLAVSA